METNAEGKRFVEYRRQERAERLRSLVAMIIASGLLACLLALAGGIGLGEIVGGVDSPELTVAYQDSIAKGL